jgi:hypothetical protein
MKLFHVSQNQNIGYDTYSDFVACAESKEAAAQTHPKEPSWKSGDVSLLILEQENSVSLDRR